MPEYDDATLEQVMREGLEFHAGSAATDLATPPGRDRHVVRRGRWVALVAAAAVVVAGGVTVAALHGSGGDDGQVAVDPGQVPSDWRYESYDGVQVRVPPDWGWGGAPMSSGGQVTMCGAQVAAVLPNIDGIQLLDHAAFVGRPVMMSDACQGGESALAWPTTSAAVWFGSPLHVGTDSSGDQVAQTIAVGAQRVTVFARDDTLRAEILSTAEAVRVDGNGCPTAPVDAPAPGPTGDASATGLSVCVYGDGRLLWSTTKAAEQAQAYATAFQQASASFDYAQPCPPKPSDQWVALGLHYTGAPPRWDLADFGCVALVGTYTYGHQGKQSSTEAPLVPSTVEPWAGGGIKAYVAGPGVTSADDPLTTYFRGVMG
ncbi:hypothetical protein [Nocardioides cynanchi]|uniref:hypothetical protein n=1 Tax=Nocardioides cynanchi TaxID=2558918 RepID=UPI001245EEFA|nr:hypothetical protein [Nocardioides cynanchi]